MSQSAKPRTAALLGQVGPLLNRLPLGGMVNNRITAAEDFVLGQLADRLGQDGLTGLPGAAAQQLLTRDRDANVRRMALLLEQAEEQNRDDAQHYLFERILRQLVPDEVRIIAALSDGLGHALLHVGAGAPVGPILRRELQNISNVGRSAGVMWDEMTPYYIQHLRSLGVCELAGEDPELEIKYEVLQGDKRVREAAKKIDKEFGMTARYIKHTLVLSPVGMALWHSCLPTERQG